MSLRAVLFQHSEPVTAGFVAPALEAAGFMLEHRFREVRPGDGDAPLVVVLGGFMGMYELDEHPFLKEELALVERRLSQGRPTLGVCLGAQMLAQACGSRVHVDPKGMVVGAERVTLTPGLGPSWVSALGEALDVPSWHGDTFEPIRGATSLGRSRHHPQELFQVGEAVGVLFHPEASVATFTGWAREHPDSLQRAGRTLEAFLRDDVPRLERGEAQYRRLLDGLAVQLAQRAGETR